MLMTSYWLSWQYLSRLASFPDEFWPQKPTKRLPSWSFFPMMSIAGTFGVGMGGMVVVGVNKDTEDIDGFGGKLRVNVSVGTLVVVRTDVGVDAVTVFCAKNLDLALHFRGLLGLANI